MPTKKTSRPQMARTKPAPESKRQTELLKSWKQISEFLGEPISVVQRWASTGMPVRREGRYVEATVDELNQWLGRQSGKPVHVVTDQTDLGAELKRGLAYLQREK